MLTRALYIANLGGLMANIHESGENYLELILDISKTQREVRSIDIARRLGVSRASVSKALACCVRQVWLSQHIMVSCAY